MPKYCHSIDNETFVGKFDSIEEAKLACVLLNDLPVGTIYHIGEVKEYSPRDFIGIADLLEKAHLVACDAVGEEKVGMWPDLSDSKYHALRELIVDFFEKNYPIDFFTAENVTSFISGE